jgi:hypothetical protein
VARERLAIERQRDAVEVLERIARGEKVVNALEGVDRGRFLTAGHEV